MAEKQLKNIEQRSKKYMQKQKNRNNRPKRANGEGGITERKDGRWQGEIIIGRDFSTGKPVKKTVYAKTKEDCASKIRDLGYEISRDLYIEPNKTPFANWLDTWLKDFKEDSLRPTTYWSYDTNIRVHIKPHLGGMTLKELNTLVIQKFIKKKYKDEGLSSATVRKIFNIINGALKQAKAAKMIASNPAEGVKLPPVENKKPRILSQDEQQKFIEALNGEKMKMLFLVSLTSGLRIGELCALKWENVNLDEGIISVKGTIIRVKDFDDDSDRKTKVVIGDPKTKSGFRTVPLPEASVTLLKIHKSAQEAERQKRLEKGKPYFDNGYVFSSYKGTLTENRNAMRAFHRILKKAFIPKSNIHSLRHTYASRLLESGANIRLIADLLGHSDISTFLNTYAHVLPDQKKEAVQVLNQIFKD